LYLGDHAREGASRDPLQRKPEVRTAIDDAFKAVPNIHYQPLHSHYGKDHVVVELLVTGTRVDGEELRFHACDILTLAGDKIAGKRSYRKVLE